MAAARWTPTSRLPTFDPAALRAHAGDFSLEAFEARLGEAVRRAWERERA